MRTARKFRPSLWLSGGCSIVFLACSKPPGATAQLDNPELRVTTGYLPAALDESSGVAVSRRHGGILWSHNDSGHDNLVYAVNQEGDQLGTFRVSLGENRDWEDIALASCPNGVGDCLYIADTGDNEARRRRVFLYVVPEPVLPVPNPDSIYETDPALSFEIRYEDGPRDVEALAVGPNGDVLFLTKSIGEATRLYTVKRSDLDRGDAITARFQGELEQPAPTLGWWVTGAAVSPAGTRAVVRTYTELLFYRWSDGGTLTPDGPPCVLDANEPQGEGVDFLDEATVVLTSESLRGRRGPITIVRCPR